MQVESLFRNAKATMHTRPIYHSSDAAIRGHVFCSFLALVLRKDLEDRCQRAGLSLAWCDVPRALDRMQRATIEQAGKQWSVRMGGDGLAAALLKAAAITPPPRVQARPPPKKDSEMPTAPAKRRGRPRCGATHT